MAPHSIRAKRELCTPELIKKYPHICLKGIRQERLDAAVRGVDQYFVVNGHYHFVVDGATFVAEAL